MKTKRNKANRRTMQVYNSVFKFRQPYQVLLDADFAVTVTTQKMDVQSRLEAVLGGVVKPMVTQCTVAHLVKLASEGSQVAQEAVDLVRTACERRKCNHWKTKSSSVGCIKGILGDTENRLRYMICTQDQSFRAHLREKVVGVPVLYVNRSGLLLLEEEGPASELRRKELEEQKLHVPPEELEVLKNAAPQLASTAAVQLISRPSPITPAPSTSSSQTVSAQRLETKLAKKKYRKGGPNPLSVKKKKSTSSKDKQMRKVKNASPNKQIQDCSEAAQKAKRKRKKAKSGRKIEANKSVPSQETQ